MNLAKSTDTRYHAWFQHNDAKGYITVAKKEPNGAFKQRHYRPEELADVLSGWIGEDVYFSQNTFYRPQRRIENIKQLRSLYVDVDSYTKGYTAEAARFDMEISLFNSKVPVPNLIIFSGRGLVCVWKIEPVPHQVLPLWQVVQNYLYEQFKHMGADSKCTDATRIFRIAGSTNSKNGAIVEVDYRHDYQYSLREIQSEYLPELIPKKDNKVQKDKKRKSVSKVARLFNLYTLYMDRANDLIRLCELRKFDVDGYREVILFLYRYWTVVYSNDPKQALHEIVELNNEFTHPLSIREVIRATRSAEKAYESNKKEYKYSNEKLIEILDITPEEQKHLKTIIGRGEKRKRNTIAKREQRGSVSRDEYIQSASGKTQSKIDELRETMRTYSNASNRQLAKIMGISEGYVRKLKAKL